MAILTQELVEEFCELPENREGLIYVEDIDAFLMYQDGQGYHKLLSTRQMKKLIYNFAKRKAKSIGHAQVKDIIFGITMSCFKEIKDLPKRYIALEDKLLDLKTFDFKDFDKKRIAYHRITCKSSDLAMPIPNFTAYLNQVLIDENGDPDPELIQVVQEMFGFYLIEDKRAEAFFFLYGEGSNGKSVMLNVLEDMVGSDYTSHVDIESITSNRFASSTLVGKKMNIVREEESRYIRIDKLKTFISGEPVMMERKNEGMFSYVPSTKFIFSTNKLPSFQGIDYALKRRLNFIPFLRRFEPHEKDHALGDKLWEELPGIVQWAIEGAKRLIANNFAFTKSIQMADFMMRFEDSVSSPRQFIHECYLEDESSFITNDELYAHYKEWCMLNGRKTVSSNTFIEELKQVTKSDMKWIKEDHKNRRGKRLKLVKIHKPSSYGQT